MRQTLSKEERDSLERGDTIAIIWGIDDLKPIAKELGISCTDDEARELLASMDRHHDAEYGICWETLRSVLLDWNHGRTST